MKNENTRTLHMSVRLNNIVSTQNIARTRRTLDEKGRKISG